MPFAPYVNSHSKVAIMSKIKNHFQKGMRAASECTESFNFKGRSCTHILLQRPKINFRALLRYIVPLFYKGEQRPWTYSEGGQILGSKLSLLEFTPVLKEGSDTIFIVLPHLNLNSSQTLSIR